METSSPVLAERIANICHFLTPDQDFEPRPEYRTFLLPDGRMTDNQANHHYDLAQAIGSDLDQLLHLGWHRFGFYDPPDSIRSIWLEMRVPLTPARVETITTLFAHSSNPQGNPIFLFDVTTLEPSPGLLYTAEAYDLNSLKVVLQAANQAAPVALPTRVI